MRQKFKDAGPDYVIGDTLQQFNAELTPEARRYFVEAVEQIMLSALDVGSPDHPAEACRVAFCGCDVFIVSPRMAAIIAEMLSKTEVGDE